MSKHNIESKEAFDLITMENWEAVSNIRNHWRDKSLDDVYGEMPVPHNVGISGDRRVQLLELMPESDDYDTTNTVVLGLPFLNGLSAHQYIRAKSMQLMNPDVPLVVMPNNSHKESAYSFNDEDRKKLATGDITPLGEIEMQALEQFDRKIRRLGVMSLTGYSQGALTVLAMGAVGSGQLNVNVINADEAPSKTGRSAKELQKDFLAGGMFDVPDEAKETEISALEQALSRPRFILDVARFGIQSLRSDSKLIHHAMSGSANNLVEAASNQDVPIKLGFIESSPMFDPASITTDAENVTIVGYGEGFSRGHATGDNVIKHALLAQDGLNLAR